MENSRVDVYIPDNRTYEQALSRTTHLAIAAHPDDIEIIGLHGIGQCLESKVHWFTGIVITDGAGAPTINSNEEIKVPNLIIKRAEEQRKAAKRGKYSAVLQLGYKSSVVKNGIEQSIVEFLCQQLLLMQPETVYLHNLADRHETHVGGCIHALEALRKLPKERHPKHVYGVEVWRDLDWLPEEYRIRLDVSEFQELSRKLINEFQSQIVDGKRYDRAVIARQTSNATFDNSHMIDNASAITLAMDMLPLVKDTKMSYQYFMESILIDLNNSVLRLIKNFQ